MAFLLLKKNNDFVKVHLGKFAIKKITKKRLKPHLRGKKTQRKKSQTTVRIANPKRYGNVAWVEENKKMKKLKKKQRKKWLAKSVCLILPHQNHCHEILPTQMNGVKINFD